MKSLSGYHCVTGALGEIICPILRKALFDSMLDPDR